MRLEHERCTHRVAVAVDVRSAALAAAPAAADRRAAQRGRADPLAVPRRQHRRAGAALLRNAAAAPAVGQRRPAATRSRALVEAIELERELLADAARGVHRDRHQPAAPGAAARLGARRWCGAAAAALTLVFESLRLQARRAAGRRLRVRRARAAQPALHPRAAAADRPRRAGGRLPARAARGRRDAGADRGLPAPLARRLRGRPAQLPHGGDRLHRRPAPLGVHASSSWRGASPTAAPRWCATASWTRAIERRAEPPMPHGLRRRCRCSRCRRVLFPGGLLTLKVFEARYLDLVAAACASSSRSAWSACARAPRCARGSDGAVQLRDRRRAGRARRGRQPSRPACCACAAAARSASSSTAPPRSRADGLWVGARLRCSTTTPRWRRAERCWPPCAALANAIAALERTGRRAVPRALPLRRRRLGGQPLVRDPADLAGRQAEADGAGRSAGAPAAGRRIPARQGRRVS